MEICDDSTPPGSPSNAKFLRVRIPISQVKPDDKYGSPNGATGHGAAFAIAAAASIAINRMNRVCLISTFASLNRAWPWQTTTPVQLNHKVLPPPDQLS